MRSVHVSKMDPSGSCVPDSGLRSEEVFLKGAGHQRTLYARWSHSCNSDPYTLRKPGGVRPRRGVASIATGRY